MTTPPGAAPPFGSVNTTAPPSPFIPPQQRVRDEFTFQMAKIEGLLFATFLVYALIVIFGWLRPVKRTSVLKTISGAGVVPLAGYLLSFVPGLMSPSSKVSNDIFTFWMAFLVYLAATTNVFSCYSIEDNEARMKRLWADYLFPWGVIVVAVYKNLAVPQILAPVLVIFILVVLKMQERREALSSATFSNFGMSRSAAVVEKFLKDDLWKDYFRKDCVAEGSDLLVDVRDLKVTLDKINKKWRTPKREKEILDEFISTSGELITMDKIREHAKAAMGSGVSTRLDDTCFSFSLFWLLLVTAAGYKTVKHPPYIREWILHDRSAEDIFGLIRTEIEFLYDFLFTNHYAVYIRGIKKKRNHLLFIFLFIWTIVPLFAEYRPRDQELAYLVINGRLVDTGVTRFVILVILIVELGHLGIFLTSNWALIIYACRSIQKYHGPNPISLFMLRTWTKLVCSLPRVHTRKRTISQYSLKSDTSCFSLPEPCVGGYIPLPRTGQKSDKHAELSPDLEEAIISFIKDPNHRIITNGKDSLKRSHLTECLVNPYVENLDTHTRVILVWHIATTKLERQYKEPAGARTEETKKHFKVATIFSKYCSYLVAFAPKLLPDHAYTSERIFDDVVNEHDMMSKDRQGDESDHEKNEKKLSTLKMGDDLYNQLALFSETDMWKTLADFWSEMLLFLSLTNNENAIEAHAQYLCTGGEFITQLWALATHTGLSRPFAAHASAPTVPSTPAAPV